RPAPILREDPLNLIATAGEDLVDQVHRRTLMLLRKRCPAIAKQLRSTSLSELSGRLLLRRRSTLRCVCLPRGLSCRPSVCRCRGFLLRHAGGGLVGRLTLVSREHVVGEARLLSEVAAFVFQ